MRYLLLVCSTLLFAVLAFRSTGQFEVKGIVINASGGSPIAGVSVSLKGTNTITTTRTDGRFSIKINKEKAVLVFSAVGYENVEQAVTNDGKEITVRMKSSTHALQEVAVTSQAPRRRALTVRAAVPRDSKAEKQYNDGYSRQLQGRVPGVVADKSSSGFH
ncbi:MAG TPA: carboxypeptidase-like regulatory domain-containing protein, partial [Flavitalea sp.]|nr:carboxypeptidase-like regulatory domain-containing protein [Flavitalea sp.]